MNITNIALGGLQAAQGTVEKTATRLASPDPMARGAFDLSAEMVALLSAKQQFQVNARVIQTADDMQQGLLDVLA
jgi:flagellar basal body rod protein FlgF